MDSLARGGIEAWGINRLQATTDLDFYRHDRNSCSTKTLPPEAPKCFCRKGCYCFDLGEADGIG